MNFNVVSSRLLVQQQFSQSHYVHAITKFVVRYTSTKNRPTFYGLLSIADSNPYLFLVPCQTKHYIIIF